MDMPKSFVDLEDAGYTLEVVSNDEMKWYELNTGEGETLVSDKFTRTQTVKSDQELEGILKAGRVKLSIKHNTEKREALNDEIEALNAERMALSLDIMRKTAVLHQLGWL